MLARGLPLNLGQSIERELNQHVPRSRLKQPEKLMLSCRIIAASAMLFTKPMCRKALRGFSSVPGCTVGQLRPDRRSESGYFGFTKTGILDSLLRAAEGGVLRYIAAFRA